MQVGTRIGHSYFPKFPVRFFAVEPVINPVCRCISVSVARPFSITDHNDSAWMASRRCPIGISFSASRKFFAGIFYMIESFLPV